MVMKCPTCSGNNRDDAAFCSSCGSSLATAPTAASTVKPVPTVKTVSSMGHPGAAVRVPPPGMCFYHPNLPAIYVCNRCGRPICRDDAKAYNDLILCPQCFTMVPPPVFYPPPPPPRARLPGAFLHR